MNIQDQVPSSAERHAFHLSPRRPAVRFGPALNIPKTGEDFAPRYPLEWDRMAELVTPRDRYALVLVGGLVTRTTGEYVTVIRASDGKACHLPPLISSFKRGRWYFSCNGLSKRQGPVAMDVLRLAALDILQHVASEREGQDAA